MDLAAKSFEASKATGAPPTGAGLPELMQVNGDDIAKLKRRVVATLSEND
jgi:hypothetical protein